MLLPTIDKTSDVPAYRQICDWVVQRVEDGTLRPGDRLPPTRTFARTLGVHRSTVLRAYGELWALGLLESRQGSYSTIRRARLEASLRPRGGGRSDLQRSTSRIDWATFARSSRRGALEDSRSPGRDRVPRRGDVDFERLAVDPNLTPLEDLRSCFRMALAREGRAVLDYGDPRGHLPLRVAIARRMSAHGVAVSADEILVTNGAQQGLDLVLRFVARPGDAVAIESPTYGMALSLFRLHELVLHDIPMRSDGMDLDALEALLERRQPILVYTIPNFHNPTGITTSQVHRGRLLALCEKHHVPIVEDGFDEEMKYFGMAVLPIKSMDSQGVVLYLGTFSKVVSPGVRIGWIAAHREAIDRLLVIQRASSLAGNTVAQAALARFCGTGLYEAYLRRIHKVYRKRMQLLLQGLRDHLPNSVEWTQPTGGYTLWLRVPGAAADEAVLRERFDRQGVRVTAGSLFFARPQADAHFRISIACADETEILEGCRRLGRALTRYLSDEKRSSDR